MSEELYTVDSAARRLKLHPATILRYIHDGRLGAAKVGKSYRILRSDLDRLAGVTGTPAASRKVQATSVVDVAGIGPDRARQIASMTTAAVNGRPEGAALFRVDVVHDPDASQLKIILIGTPGDTSSMLALLDIWLEA